MTDATARIELDSERPPPVDEAALWQKCSWRVLSLLFPIFFFSHLNRVNLSYAAAPMTLELGFSPLVYGMGAGYFFLGYALLQIPVNVFAARVGVTRIMTLLMVSWGVVSTLNGAIHTAHHFYILRFLLGVFEAGVSPLLTLLVTQWFTPTYRGVAFAYYALAMPVAGAIGGPVSAAILSGLDGVGGLAGWRWLFFLEAVPTFLLAIVTLRYLPAGPDVAPWLSQQERLMLRGTPDVARFRVPRESSSSSTDVPMAFSLRVLLLSLVWATFTGAFVGLFYWMPKLLAEVFHFSNERVGMYVGVGYACLGVAMVITGRATARMRRTRELLIVTYLALTIALSLASTARTSAAVSVLLLVSMALIGVGISAFWAIGLRLFSPKEAPLGIAIVNCTASVSSFAMLSIYGAVAASYGSVQTGLASLVAAVALSTVCMTFWFSLKLGRPALAA